MNYKETLFFIGKCLTISRENAYLKSVSETIQSQQVNWDQVVQLSTSHYVFPALYLNLYKNDLLSFLPEDLVEYMKHITELNRERNQAILDEAREVNALLLEHGIRPIFLKGTGFLIQNLYNDLGERMVGDIDLLVRKDQLSKTVDLLKELSYQEKGHRNLTFVNRHYTRLINPNRIASIEVHHSMISSPYRKKFDYDWVESSLIQHQDMTVLSLENQLLLTVFNKQINDRGHWKKSIALRNCYDLFLLSSQVNPLKVIQNFGFFFNVLNNFLASSQWILNSNTIKSEKTSASEQFIEQQRYFINHPEQSKKSKKNWDRYFAFKGKLIILGKLFYDKRAWSYIYQRIFK